MMRTQLQYLHRALQISSICLRNLIEILLERLLRREAVPGPQRLRSLLEELSGSFLKFGQILSLQVDTLSREYCDALLSLLDRVPPFHTEQVDRVFLEELGKRPRECFEEFNYRPVASASIGQVHHARLANGPAVAVKVQRPGIREIFLRDAALLRVFIRIVFLFRIRTLYFMRDPIREFTEWLHDELDYRREATYAEVLRQNSTKVSTEVVPRIFWDMTTQRIMTMEYLEGHSVMEYLRILEQGDEKRLADLKNINFDPSKYLSNVISNFLSDSFRFGVFHADLHPANLLIMKNNVVGYVDFGIVGSLTPEARRKVIQLSLAYVRGKTDELFAAFLDISTITHGANLAGFRSELDRRSGRWYREPSIGGVPHFSRSLTIAMIDLLVLCREYGLLVDRELIKYIRSLMLADGLVSRLAPGLDLAPQIRKVCEDFLAHEVQDKLFSRSAMLSMIADFCGWLQAGPGRMIHAMERMERRQMKLQTRRENAREQTEGFRVRLFVVAGVWLVTAIAALAGSLLPSAPSTPLASTLMFGFLGVWTLWLLTLMRRLARE